MGDQETQQLAGRDPEHALVGVELAVYPAAVVEGLVQVLDEGVHVPGLDHDVIDVRFNIAAQLRPEARLHCALEGSAGCGVAAPGGDECRLLLVFHRHHDLVIPGEGIQETQQLAPGRGVHDRVDARQRVRVLGASLFRSVKSMQSRSLEEFSFGTTIGLATQVG